MTEVLNTILAYLDRLAAVPDNVQYLTDRLNGLIVKYSNYVVYAVIALAIIILVFAIMLISILYNQSRIEKKIDRIIANRERHEL